MILVMIGKTLKGVTVTVPPAPTGASVRED